MVDYLIDVVVLRLVPHDAVGVAAGEVGGFLGTTQAQSVGNLE